MKKLIVILAVVFCGHHCSAQVSKLRTNSPKGINSIKGDYYFDHHNYVKAVENYTKSVKQNPKDVHSILRIAEAYHRSDKDGIASEWYKKAFILDSNIEEKYILKYIFTLFKSYKYEELNRWLNIYNVRVGKNLLSNDSANIMYKDSTLLLVKNLKSINSGNSEISPNWYNDQLFFSTDRSVVRNGHNNGDYNLYSAVLTPNSQYESLKPLHEEINSEANEGPLAIAEQSGQLFFTREGLYQVSDDTMMEVFFCDIPVSPEAEVNISRMDLKKINNHIGHPAVNSDGTLLIFASKNVENNKGFDLYRCEFNGKKWSKPIALSNAINTNGDQMYPTIHNDSVLFFASNGHGGLGGYDIFKVNLLHSHAQVEHLDFPINTASDDFGLFLKGDTGEGYLSSNRPGGLGSEDLYKVYIQHIQTKSQIDETVDESISKLAALSIYASNGEVINLSGNTIGSIEFDFVPDVEYTLLINKDNYMDKSSIPEEKSISKIVLSMTDIYTFKVQKLVENVSDQTGGITRIQDIHINPGDLITFQLIPNVEDFSKSVESRVRLGNKEVTINGRETLVFGYVAEETPKIAGQYNNMISEDLGTKIEEELPLDDKITDPVLLTDSGLLAQIQPEDEEIETDTLMLTNEETQDVAQVDEAKDIVQELEDKLAEEVTEDSDSTQLVATDSVLIEQTQPYTKEIEADTLMLTHEAADVAQNNKPIDADLITNDSTHLEVVDSLITQEEIAIELFDEDSVKMIAQADPSMVIDEEPSDTLDITNDIAKTTQLSDSSQALSLYDNLESGKEEEGNNIQFRVQIAAAKSLISDAHLKRIYSGMKEINFFEEEGYYKYYISKTPSYPTARLILKESGVEDAFIVAYKGDTKWRLRDAIAFEKKKLKELTLKIDPTLPSDKDVEVVKYDEPLDIDQVPDDELAGEVIEDSTQLFATDSVLIAQIQPNDEEIETDTLSFTDEETLEVAQVDEAEEIGQALNDELAEEVTEDSTQLVATDSVQIAQIQPNDEEIEADTLSITDEKTLEAAQVDEPADIGQEFEDELAEVVTEDSVQLVAIDSVQIAQIQPDDEEIEADTLTLTDEKTLEAAQVDEPVDVNQVPDDELAEVVTEDSVQLVAIDSVQIAQIQPDDEEIETDTFMLTDEEAQELVQVDEGEDIDRELANEATESSDKEERDDFQYRVQIAASRSEISETDLKRMYNGSLKINSFQEDGYYKYYIAETPNYFVAGKILKESEVEKAFIAVYYRNEKWRLKDAIALQYKKPLLPSELDKSDSVLKIIKVNFEFDEFTLSPDELLHLRNYVIDQLEANELSYSIVNGYTDIRGSDAYNYGLSQERASFVQNVIINEGISPERVKTKFFGESQLLKYCPENENCNESVHQANRRVEILLLISKK